MRTTKHYNVSRQSKDDSPFLPHFKNSGHIDISVAIKNLYSLRSYNYAWQYVCALNNAFIENHKSMYRILNMGYSNIKTMDDLARTKNKVEAIEQNIINSFGRPVPPPIAYDIKTFELMHYPEIPFVYLRFSSRSFNNGIYDFLYEQMERDRLPNDVVIPRITEYDVTGGFRANTLYLGNKISNHYYPRIPSEGKTRFYHHSIVNIPFLYK